MKFVTLPPSLIIKKTAKRLLIYPVNLIAAASFLLIATNSFATNVSGSISTNTTWNSAGSPYIVTGNITIDNGVTLTIDPNVDIKFDGNYVINSNGVIDAQGTSGNEILFTSNDGSPARGDWSWIGIYGSGSLFEYVKIEYADAAFLLSGSSVTLNNVIIENTYQGIYAVSGASAIINNSTLDNNSYWNIRATDVTLEITDTQISNSGYGIYATNISGTISGSEITDNSSYGLYLSDTSLAIIDNMIDDNANGIYAIDGSSPAITGNVITNSTYGIYITGSSPSFSEPVINNNALYDNTVNLFAAGQVGIIIDAENNWWGSADAGEIAASILDVGDNIGYALVDWTPFLDGANGDPVEGNFIYGTISANTTWYEADTPHYIIGAINIAEGVTLTIEPGVTVKFNADYGLTVDGTLDAQGTSDEPIVFTSNEASPAQEDWDGILFNNDGSELSYCTVEYSDYGLYFDGVTATLDHITVNSNNYGISLLNLSVGTSVENINAFDNSYGLYLEDVTGIVTISNNTFAGNLNGIHMIHASAEIADNLLSGNSTGIFVAQNTNGGSSPDITNNEIAGNGTGIQIFGTIEDPSNPVINDNSIFENNNWNIYTETDTGVIIDAQNNWWGTGDMNVIAQKIQDSADNPAYTAVDWIPFLDGPSGDPLSVDGTLIYGIISSNTNWTSANNPYIIIANTTIDTGATLTIDPDVVVKFNGDYYLAVEGTLDAQGTVGNEIVFTSNKALPARGDWQSIWFKNTGSALTYAIVQFADEGIFWDGVPATIDHVISENNTSGFTAVAVTVAGTISSSTFRKNSTGITLSNASPTITGNLISHNLNCGIELNSDGYGCSTSVIDNNQIVHNYGGICMVGSSGTPCQPVINNNWIYENVDSGSGPEAISNNIGAGPAPAVTINAENNWWGTDDPDEIELTILHFVDDTGLSLVDFAPYGSGSNTIDISDVYVSQLTIDLSTDGTTAINYTVNGTADVTMRVYNWKTHQLVRTIISGQSRSSGAHYEVWDGKNDGGNPLPNNLYYYTILAVDELSGNEGYYDPVYYQGSVTIESASITETFNPLKGEEATLTYELYQPALLLIRIGIQDASQGIIFFALVDEEPRLESDSDTWDGRYDNGMVLTGTLQSAFFWAYVLPDNGIIIRSEISESGVSLEADPYVINAVYNEITTIAYELPEDATVKLEIRSSTGASPVKTLVNNVFKTAGTYSVVWEADDILGRKVTPEDYMIRITATGASGALVEEVNIRVWE